MPAELPPFIVAIPARHASTRLPGKPLRLLAGEPMIAHVCRRAQEAGAAGVVVATDDVRIAEVATAAGADAVLTAPELPSGSDRLAAAGAALRWPDDAMVVNLQGDEPLAPPACIRAVMAALAGGDAPMATLAAPLADVRELFDPNCVKLVRDARGRALYFSRAPVPWSRDAFTSSRDALPVGVPFLRHIGIYAYRAGFLRRFAALAPTPLELAERLEQLRALEHGHAIAVALAPEPFPGGVDTAEDLARAERFLAGEPA